MSKVNVTLPFATTTDVGFNPYTSVYMSIRPSVLILVSAMVTDVLPEDKVAVGRLLKSLLYNIY